MPLLFVNDATDLKNLSYDTILVVPDSNFFKYVKNIETIYPNFSYLGYTYYPHRHKGLQPPSTEKDWTEISILTL